MFQCNFLPLEHQNVIRITNKQLSDRIFYIEKFIVNLEAKDTLFFFFFFNVTVMLSLLKFPYLFQTLIYSTFLFMSFEEPRLSDQYAIFFQPLSLASVLLGVYGLSVTTKSLQEVAPGKNRAYLIERKESPSIICSCYLISAPRNYKGGRL